MDRQRRKKRIWEQRDRQRNKKDNSLFTGEGRLPENVVGDRWAKVRWKVKWKQQYEGLFRIGWQMRFFCVRVFGLWVIVVIGWKEPGLSYPFTVFWLLVSTATISVRTTMSTTWKAAAKACHAQYTNHGLHMVCC